MKKIVLFLMLIVLAVTLLPKPIRADEKLIGPLGSNSQVYKIVLKPDKVTALADGYDRIKISFGNFYIKEIDPSSVGASLDNPKPLCLNGELYDKTITTGIVISGSGNSLTGVDHETDFNGIRYAIMEYPDCGTGYSSIYLSSTHAEDKTVEMAYFVYQGTTTLVHKLSIKVNFVSPSTSSSPSASTPRTITRTTPAPTVAKPAPPVLSTLNNVTTPENNTFTNSIREGGKIVLSGKTTPNTKVKLYIYSEPKTAEVTSDADGDWTYTIENLEKGDHRVEAEVTDDKGVTSDKVELAKFTIKEKLIPIEPEKAEPYKFQLKHLLNPTNYILVGVLVILVAGLIVIEIKRRKTAQGRRSELGTELLR